MLVLYRMFDPPVPAGGLIALSLREGCWLALLGSLMMVLGPMWPRVTFEPARDRSRAGVVAGTAGGERAARERSSECDSGTRRGDRAQQLASGRLPTPSTIHQGASPTSHAGHATQSMLHRPLCL
jgi:hypothetical protein